MNTNIDIHVEVKDNAIVALFANITKSQFDGHVEWNFNYYKAKPTYIGEIVVSNELKGILLKSLLGNDFEYKQAVVSESIAETIATVIDIVTKHVLNGKFDKELKNKQLELLEKQSQELNEKMSQLKGEIE